MAYSGPSLEPETDFVWSVCWWSSATPDLPSPWSNNFTFSTGLAVLDNGAQVDWSGAVWIAAASEKKLNKNMFPGGKHLRTTIVSPGNLANNGAPLVNAKLYIAGAGYYRCAVDGVRIGHHVMGATTDFWYRLYYDTYDVLEALRTPGNHVLSCLLGRGRYGQMRNSIGQLTCTTGVDSDTVAGHLRSDNSPPCNPGIRVKLTLTYADAQVRTVVSNKDTWKSLASPVLADDLFQGETYNLTLAKTTREFSLPDSAIFPDSLLANASVNGSNGFGAPNRTATMYSSWTLPPIKVFNVSKAVDVWAVNDSWVVDFGVNGAGVATINTTTKSLCGGITSGQVKVTMQYGEALHSHRGALFHHFANSAEVTVLYADCGAAPDDRVAYTPDDRVAYTPVFDQSGFRYMSVKVQLPSTGGGGQEEATFVPTKEMFSAQWFSTSFEPAGTFLSSHAGLNAINDMVLRSVRSNFMSIPTDCPTRERAGWLGDAHVAAETVLRNFDAGSTYRLFLHQIGESEDRHGNPPDGDVMYEYCCILCS